MRRISFRVDDAQALGAQAWGDRLGIGRSALLRDALRRHLQHLAGEREAGTWELHAVDDGEGPFLEIAGWGPAEDWSDWTSGEGRCQTST